MAKAAFLYEEVAGSVAGLIGQGSIPPGSKMPSLRAMSSELGVSISTVMQAYQLLESRGLIETQPQSGHYVRHAPPLQLMAPTVTAPDPAQSCVPVNPMLHEFQRSISEGSPLPLGCGAPSLDFLPCARIAALIAQVARELPQSMDYIFPPGDYELRRQIAARSIRWLGALRPQDVLITSGGMDAMNLTLRAVTRPGDTVAIESPTFFGVLQVLENLGLRAVEIPTCPQQGIDVEALEQVCRKQKISAAILIPSFSNPLGALMPEDARKRLVDVARKGNFIVIEDDIYGELHYSQRRIPPIKAFDTDGRVIMCSSFSKTLLPGLRIGWIATERYIRRLEELQFNSTICAPTIQQHALARFLDSGSFDTHLRRLRRSISASMDRFAAAICEHFPAGTRMTRPQGGFVTWVELPENVDSIVLFRQALNAGISIAPGPLFSTQPHYSNFIRLNCGHPWSERMEDAVTTLGVLIKTLAR